MQNRCYEEAARGAVADAQKLDVHLVDGAEDGLHTGGQPPASARQVREEEHDRIGGGGEGRAPRAFTVLGERGPVAAVRFVGGGREAGGSEFDGEKRVGRFP